MREIAIDPKIIKDTQKEWREMMIPLLEKIDMERFKSVVSTLPPSKPCYLPSDWRCRLLVGGLL